MFKKLTNLAMQICFIYVSFITFDFGFMPQHCPFVTTTVQICVCLLSRSPGEKWKKTKISYRKREEADHLVD